MSRRCPTSVKVMSNVRPQKSGQRRRDGEDGGVESGEVLPTHRLRLPAPSLRHGDTATILPARTPRLCLDVRQRNQGIDGKPVLFHRRGKEVLSGTPKPSRRKTTPDDSRYRNLLDGLKSLGMGGVTPCRGRGGAEGTRGARLGEEGQRRGTASGVPPPQTTGYIPALAQAEG